MDFLSEIFSLQFLIKLFIKCLPFNQRPIIFGSASISTTIYSVFWKLSSFREIVLKLLNILRNSVENIEFYIWMLVQNYAIQPESIGCWQRTKKDGGI